MGEAKAGDFSACVKEGKMKNQELRAAHPDAPFLQEEIVIRVTFASLKECYHEVDTSLVKNANETTNPVFSNFMSMASCKQIPLEEVPGALRTIKESDEQYRGMLLGKGLPQETLVEVLVDPE